MSARPGFAFLILIAGAIALPRLAGAQSSELCDRLSAKSQRAGPRDKAPHREFLSSCARDPRAAQVAVRLERIRQAEAREAEARAQRERQAEQQRRREAEARLREQREQEAWERAERERYAREQAAREQAVREQAVREQAAREQAARERAAREQAARERAAREQAAREQAAKEEAAREQAAKEQAAREQAERERLERERYAQENGRRIIVINGCGYDITVRLIYYFKGNLSFSPNGNTAAFWVFKPDEHSFVSFTDRTNVRTNSADIYYNVVDPNGEWLTGNSVEFDYGTERIKFTKTTASLNADGDYELRFCK